MKFKVIKSSFDGICGGVSDFDKLEDVLLQVFYYRGWPSLEDLHAAIKKWADNAKPGDVFCTQVTAIVAAGTRNFYQGENKCVHCNRTGLDYDDLIVGDVDETVEQIVTCPFCNMRWIDVFTLTGQRVLRKGD